MVWLFGALPLSFIHSHSPIIFNYAIQIPTMRNQEKDCLISTSWRTERLALRTEGEEKKRFVWRASRPRGKLINNQ